MNVHLKLEKETSITRSMQAITNTLKCKGYAIKSIGVKWKNWIKIKYKDQMNDMQL